MRCTIIPRAKESKMKKITPDDLNKRLKKKEVILVDVREPVEHKTEAIEGAHLIPLADISQRTLPSKTKPIVFHCQAGKRSEAACKKLLAKTPNLEIYSLEGGIAAWKNAGLPVKIAQCNVWSLQRQVLFVAGLFAFIGFALGYYYNPAFHLLSAFVALGLIFAGVTGKCGMALLLAKMPWNK